MRRRQHRNRICELRQARGLREADLAAACEPPVSNASVISRLESGILALTQDWCYRLAKALGCRPWDFFPEIVEMPLDDQILALWNQLDIPSRAALLPRLLTGKLLEFEAAPDAPEMDDRQRLADFTVRDIDGVYHATFYSRRRR